MNHGAWVRAIPLAVAVTIVPSFPSSGGELPHGVVVERIDHKVLSGPDEDGDLKISVKVVLRNSTDEDVVVDLEIEAIDSDDFEVLDVSLSGMVAAKGSRSLSDWQYVNEKSYKSIAKWQLDED